MMDQPSGLDRTISQCGTGADGDLSRSLELALIQPQFPRRNKPDGQGHAGGPDIFDNA